MSLLLFLTLSFSLFVPGLQAIGSGSPVLVGQVIDTRPQPLNPQVPAPASPSSDRAVFLTAYSVGNRKFLDQTLDRLEAAGGNAIIFDVKGNEVYFDVESPLVHDLSLKDDRFELREVIDYLHERGFTAIGRFDAIQDHGLTAVRPETAISHPHTGEHLSPGWIDPSNPLALEYNSHSICELAAAGIDEINLDYIRYSTEKAGSLAVISAQEREDRLEQFMAMARETIDRCGPKTRLGISTFAILGWDFKHNVGSLGQDVVRFAPYVDIISPMAYPISFSESYVKNVPAGQQVHYLVYETLTGYQKLLGPAQANKLRPWIQGYGFTSKGMAQQMKAVTDSGLCGFMVWNAGNRYEHTYDALAEIAAFEGCR